MSNNTKWFEIIIDFHITAKREDYDYFSVDHWVFLSVYLFLYLFLNFK